MRARRFVGYAVLIAAAIGTSVYLRSISEPEAVLGDASEPLIESEPESVFDSGPPLTSAQESVYGTRADFFETLPAEFRPDLDWRSVLNPSLADVNVEWSQGNEELIIRDFFRDREKGFYLDVGCSVPRVGSTTYKLESELGWRGIGIDVMEKFGPQWATHRPESTFIAKAVSDKDGETLTLYMDGIFASLDGEAIEGLAGELTEITVETITLNTVLQQQGVDKVDFLSMDIEGAEPEALRGFDIQRYKPDLCCIEANKGSEVSAYFEANGYELIEKYHAADKINLYFRPKAQE